MQSGCNVERQTPLAETKAVLGVSSLSKKAFMSTEKCIGEWCWDLLKDSVKQTGQEKKVNAICKGHYHQGIPVITVIIDVGWCKKSHKYSYNVKSGAGIIIGKGTEKILCIGVGKKCCSVCHNNLGILHVPPHDCFVNWDQ